MTMRYVALLRGINVGGKNIIPMKELVRLFVGSGCTDVENYIQSGNVVFTAGPGIEVKTLGSQISRAIEERFGCVVPVVLRSSPQMKEIVRTNPFLAAGSAVDLLHVGFLAEAPSAGAVTELNPERSPGDRFAVVGAQIYLELGNGMGKTKLTNAYFDARLRTVGTVRNWRTVLKLLDMLGS